MKDNIWSDKFLFKYIIIACTGQLNTLIKQIQYKGKLYIIKVKYISVYQCEDNCRKPFEDFKKKESFLQKKLLKNVMFIFFFAPET